MKCAEEIDSEEVGTARVVGVEARSAALEWLLALVALPPHCRYLQTERETACWPLSGPSGPRTPTAQHHSDSRAAPSPRSSPPLLLAHRSMSHAASRVRARSVRVSPPTPS